MQKRNVGSSTSSSSTGERQHSNSSTPNKTTANGKQKTKLNSDLELTIAQNKLDQEKIDFEIILSGFPNPPNVDVAVKKFADLLKLNISDLKAWYYFEGQAGLGGRVTKERNRVVIVFNEKSTKLNVLVETAAMTSPLRLSQLSNHKFVSVHQDPVILCLNRFSHFNLTVETQLQRLLSHGIIKSYKFTDFFFEFKQSSKSAWKTVTHAEVISRYHSLLQLKWNLMPSKYRLAQN